MADPLPGQPSCPECGARAGARAKECAECGYAFVEDPPRRSATPAASGRFARGRYTAHALAAAGLAVAAAAALWAVPFGGEEEADAGRDRPRATGARTGLEVLARRPLSARAAERRLEERYSSAGDDDTASASCSALQPRPAHAIRWCEIRYAHGGERTVIVLSNPQGHELLIER